MEIEERNCELFADCNVVYLYCTDRNEQIEFEFTGLSCLKLVTVVGHLSFPENLQDRRRALFLKNENLHLLEKKKSPVVIKVLASSLTEIEGDTIVLVCKIEVLQQSSVASSVPSAVHAGFIHCNCLLPNKTKNIILPYNQSSKTIHQHTNDTSSESEGEDYSTPQNKQGEKREVSTDDDLFTESIKLKGCTFHKHFQDCLRICKQKLMKKELVELKLHSEPTNIRDENGIVIQANTDSNWKPIGYIPGKKIAKINAAMQENNIKIIRFKSIDYCYNYFVDGFRYIPTVIITKQGRWPKDEKGYEYNSLLDSNYIP